MRAIQLYSTTALSLCLMASSAIAQSGQVTAEELDLFDQEARACIADPESAACLPFLAIVSSCAADLNATRCAPLFEDASVVFDNPEHLERVQQILDRVDAELAQLHATGSVIAEPDELPDEQTGALENDIEPQPLPDEQVQAAPLDTGLAPEADIPEEADQTIPEAIEDADADDLSEPEALADEDDDAAAIEQLQERLDAGMAEQALEDESLASEEVPAPEAPADVADESAALEALRHRLEDALAEAPSDPQEDTVDSAETAPQTEARSAQEQLSNLLGDDIADEAPQLVIEDKQTEELVAPVETPRELAPSEQAAIEQLLEDPSVSTAIGLLSTALGSTTEETEDSDAESEAEPVTAARDPAEDDAEIADVIEEQITSEQLRSSQDDFESRFALDFETDSAARTQRAERSRRDLERAGLAALGALAVGMVINQNRVVARSDERVVVDQGQGQLELWRDDDAILLEDGSVRRIERYSDGSTRTRWERLDGTQIITIRDATGRVLRRDRVLPDGTIIELVDDTRPVERIDVSILPPPQTRELRITARTDPELAIAMLREAEAEARALDRRFSLRQIREIREVRELVPLLSPDLITFETNRANVRPEEAAKLLQVGRLMERLLANNPREIFLIEGHTDATGPAAFNLALSDRRAESVALALTEFFDIPSENLIVQGYGKRYLRIPTLQSEERNRRVVIRRITPLLNF